MIWRIRKYLLVSVVLVSCFVLLQQTPVYAQDWAKSENKFQQRVDLRELGYPSVNEIPENSSAITSLLAARDGLIYGGTCGEEAYLFVFNPAANKVRHLGKIKGQEAIHHALVEDRDGLLYLGTGKNPFSEVALSPGGIGKEYIDETLWADIRKPFEGYAGGHLYLYDPAKSNSTVKLPDMECDLVDLGIPVAGNSIYALTINSEKGEIYGISYPDGHFFLFDISTRQFKDLGEIDQRIVFNGPERHWRSLPRALVCDDSGRVFTTGNGGNLVCYDSDTGKIVSTGLQIPMDIYPAQFEGSYAVAEYFARAGGGLIYGGSSDGYLFSFDPQKMELLNLGKLRSERRIRAVTVAKSGKIYVVAGQRESTRPCQLYCYNPLRGDFERLGLMIADRSPHYYWRGYQFDCMTTGMDGTIYLGESERRSHLFLYIPE
jgi:hypothetical protein